VAIVNSTTHNQKIPRLWERTDRAWFTRFLCHPARKQSGSILTTLEPARGQQQLCNPESPHWRL